MSATPATPPAGPPTSTSRSTPSATPRPTRIQRWSSTAETLDDGGVGHAAAFAHGLEAVAAAGALELVEQRGHELGARAAQRVTEGDGAAIHVDLVHVGMVLLLPCQHDRGEGLVDLEQVD